MASGRTGVSITRWLRAKRADAALVVDVRKLTRVRHQPRRASSPGFPAGEIVVTGSTMPPKRTSASSSTHAFSRRCSARSM
ncbi:MAG: hypothetical protein R2692_00815 [Microbacterium sp.]